MSSPFRNRSTRKPTGTTYSSSTRIPGSALAATAVVQSGDQRSDTARMRRCSRCTSTGCLVRTPTVNATLLLQMRSHPTSP